MDAMNDALEERLARLENGESLEVCLAGLPDEEAILLKKAAALTTMAQTAPTSKRLTDHRRKFLELAKEKNMNPSQSTNKTQRGWVFPLALTGGALAAFTCLVVFALIAGVFGLRWFGSDQVARGAPDPQSARIQGLRGLVEVQNATGEWQVAEVGQVLEAGQSIRTGKLSSVVLGFFDGSKSRLGPEAELSITELDAQKSGPRVVLLSQRSGESQHEVAHASDPASRYEVATPSGVGAAKGTSFNVFVFALFARFDVDEGAVAVTNLNVTVIVVAGQTTVVEVDHAPTSPVFRISGEGIVEQTGSVWHIAGRTFRTDANTVFVGDPQVGDIVSFQARIVKTGSPILDRVVLISNATESRFSFSGTVDSVSDSAWTISGKSVQVDESTHMDAGIVVGDTVEVTGEILEDGNLLATDIRLIESDDDLPFNFVGVVEAISANEWTVSGNVVLVDENTTIEEGLVVGDLVRVRGRIQENDWLAKSITRADDDDGREFTLTGTVDDLDPWTVNGVTFETDDQTEIGAGIEAGDTVRVTGRILEDGTWVAERIELLEEQASQQFDFNGIVNSMNPWDVSGIPFTTDENTVIDAQIVVGDEVRVRGVVQPDGVWLAESIERLTSEDDDDLGCFSFSTGVREASVNQIVLQDWQVIQLTSNIQVNGQITVATVILVSGCTQGNGTIIITHIVVIYIYDGPTPVPSHENDNGQNNGGNGNDNDSGGNDNDD